MRIALRLVVLGLFALAAAGCCFLGTQPAPAPVAAPVATTVPAPTTTIARAAPPATADEALTRHRTAHAEVVRLEAEMAHLPTAGSAGEQLRLLAARNQDYAAARSAEQDAEAEWYALSCPGHDDAILRYRAASDAEAQAQSEQNAVALAAADATDRHDVAALQALDSRRAAAAAAEEQAGTDRIRASFDVRRGCDARFPAEP